MCSVVFTREVFLHTEPRKKQMSTKRAFTKDEQKILIENYEKYLGKPATLAPLLDNRSISTVANHLKSVDFVKKLKEAGVIFITELLTLRNCSCHRKKSNYFTCTVEGV